MRRTRMIAALAVLMVATAPAALRASAQDSADVNIEDFQFSPSDVFVDAGATVIWSHVGDAPHTVTADDGSFDSRSRGGNLSNGDTFDHQFTDAGTYTYKCNIHPGQMRGTVVVNTVQPRPDEAPPPADEIPPAAEETQPDQDVPVDDTATSETDQLPETPFEGEDTTTTTTEPEVEQTEVVPALGESPRPLAAARASDSRGANVALYVLGVVGLASVFAGMLLAARRRPA